jgi:hypothetical protein
MKAFVYDHQHNGAEIYFSESREKAVEYFRQGAIEIFKNNIERYKQTDLTKYSEKQMKLDITNEEHRIDYVSSKDFTLYIQEYEVSEGKSFWTDGGD